MVQGVNIENGCIVDVNPATGAVIDRVPVSSSADVDAAVRAANLAQPAWAALSVTERTVAVKAAVRRIGAIKVTLAPLITTEMGKTLREAELEVDDNSDMDAYCDLVAAANAPEIHGCSVIVRHAHGVVSICAPWNYPIEEIVMLSIPALVAGNAIVIKPSEVVPHASGAVVKCLMDGLNGAYPGLVGLLQGDGGVGGYLVAHPDVHMCAFTGSTATGANVLESASKTMKRVVLECGGKDPMVVMGDADLDQAAMDAVTFSLQNCGQVCCAIERVYVAEAVASEFELKVLQHASKWKAGDGMDDSSTIGPCVSEMQRQTVHAHVQAAIESGARCLLGGKMPPASDRGTFYPPTVLANVPHVSQITQDETFGPVLAISTFAGDDETAIQLANDSTYGLTASVYSGDLARAGRIAGRISAGQVGINKNPLSGTRDLRCPFVGHKRSGYGSHSGTDGWRQFSTPKSLIYTAPPPRDALPPQATALPLLVPASIYAVPAPALALAALGVGVALGAAVAVAVSRR
jgi:succinate-semialdehyde dehydrogenase/glutarate-semialdehyde dehydrogenase